MGVCQKDYAKLCEIQVRVADPAGTHLNRYNRLRFGLLASCWFPTPLGILLWSALHVLLLLWKSFLMVVWVAQFLVFVLPVFVVAFVVTECALSVFGFVAIVFGFLSFLDRSIRYCWSGVCKHVRFLPQTSEDRIVVWRKSASWATTRQLCRDGNGMMVMLLKWYVGEKWSFNEIREKIRALKLVGEEIVHLHDAVVIGWNKTPI